MSAGAGEWIVKESAPNESRSCRTSPVSRINQAEWNPTPDIPHNIEGRIDLNRDLILHPFQTYYARVEGDSMIDAGIPDGSYAAFDSHIQCVDKDIVIACINDELCIKTLREEEGKVWLEPANDAHAPIEITEEMDFRVLGCVTFIFHWVASHHVPYFRISRCR